MEGFNCCWYWYSWILDGTEEVAKFNAPCGITSDGTNLYVADIYENHINKIKITSKFKKTVIAGNGMASFFDGDGKSAMFSHPYGITCDSNLYVADTVNDRIRKIEISTGKVTTIAGDGRYRFSDGIGTSAQFKAPRGLLCVGSDLYVADTESHRIRKIEISTGRVTTIAGDGACGYLDGDGLSAKFNNPYSIATDDLRNLYIADTNNHMIRKLTFVPDTKKTDEVSLLNDLSEIDEIAELLDLYFL